MLFVVFLGPILSLNSLDGCGSYWKLLVYAYYEHDLGIEGNISLEVGNTSDRSIEYSSKSMYLWCRSFVVR